MLYINILHKLYRQVRPAEQLGLPNGNCSYPWEVQVEIDDACHTSKKEKSTIYILARKRIIPSYKRGKKLYFYEDKLLAGIEFVPIK